MRCLILNSHGCIITGIPCLLNRAHESLHPLPRIIARDITSSTFQAMPARLLRLWLRITDFQILWVALITGSRPVRYITLGVAGGGYTPQHHHWARSLLSSILTSMFTRFTTGQGRTSRRRQSGQYTPRSRELHTQSRIVESCRSKTQCRRRQIGRSGPRQARRRRTIFPRRMFMLASSRHHATMLVYFDNHDLITRADKCNGASSASVTLFQQCLGRLALSRLRNPRTAFIT